MSQNQSAANQDDPMTREHYVSQFHLRYFTGDDGLLDCYDKVNGTLLRLHPTDVAVAQGFFRIVLPDSSRRSLEGVFQDLENYWAPAVAAVVRPQPRDTGIVLPPQQLTLIEHSPTLVNFVAVQLLRPRFLRELIRADPQAAPILGTGDLPENTLRLLHAFVVAQGARDLPARLVDLAWYLVPNYSSTPFWASDNPVVMYSRDIQHATVAPIEELLQSPGIRLHLPLTPELALAIYDPDNPPFDPAQGIANEQWVWGANRMVLKASLRQVYAPRSDFNVARKMIANDPSIRTPAFEHSEWAGQGKAETENIPTERDADADA